MDFLYFEDAKEFLEGEGWKREKYINLSDAHSGLRYTKSIGERRADLFLLKNADKYCYARVLFYEGDKLMMEKRVLKRRDWKLMEGIREFWISTLDNYFEGVYGHHRCDNGGNLLDAKP